MKSEMNEGRYQNKEIGKKPTRKIDDVIVFIVLDNSRLKTEIKTRNSEKNHVENLSLCSWCLITVGLWKISKQGNWKKPTWKIDDVICIYGT